MNNKYISVKDYEEYISLFELSENDKKYMNQTIQKVWQIINLKNETVQITPNLYLKPIMFPEDYRRIDKVLNNQKEFKLERETKRFENNLRKCGKYAENEIADEVEKFKDKLAKELKIKCKCKRKKINEEILKIDDLDFLEEE